MIYHFKNIQSCQVHSVAGWRRALIVAELIERDKREDDYFVTTTEKDVIIENNLTVDELINKLKKQTT